MSQNPDDETYLRPSAAAALLGVTTKTLSRMAERGTIKGIRLDSGHRRYDEQSVRDYKSKSAA